MRHRERRHAGSPGQAVDAGVALQQPGQLLALGRGGSGGADRCRDGRLVDRGNAGEDCPGARRHLCESRTFGREPKVGGRRIGRRQIPRRCIAHQRHLTDPVRDEDPMAASQHPEHGQRAGRLVRPRALEHQHRAMVGQPPHLRQQPQCRGRMQVQGVIGGIPGDHGHIDGEFDGAVHGRREAAIGLLQVARPVVQVGQVRHPQAMRLTVRTVRSRTPVRDTRQFRALRTGTALRSFRRAHDATCCSSALTLSA